MEHMRFRRSITLLSSTLLFMERYIHSDDTFFFSSISPMKFPKFMWFCGYYELCSAFMIIDSEMYLSFFFLLSIWWTNKIDRSIMITIYRENKYAFLSLANTLSSQCYMLLLQFDHLDHTTHPVARHNQFVYKSSFLPSLPWKYLYVCEQGKHN